jgi:glucose-6-phosphate isomerase
MATLRFETRRANARPAGRRDPASGLSERYGLTAAEMEAMAEPTAQAVREMVDERCLCSLRPSKVENRRAQGYDIDAGFLDIPTSLLDDAAGRRPTLPLATKLEQVLSLAADIRRSAWNGGPDAFVLLGIGGSYLGAAALINAFTHPYHNELLIDQRGGAPRIYYAGNGLDPVELVGLLDRIGRGPFVLNVVSKSGTTFETAAAYRVLRKALLDRGTRPEDLARYILATTAAGPRSALQRLAADPYRECRLLTMPDFVGGRYSVFTPVGLLPAAVAGLNVKDLLRGAADMTERCLDPDLNTNPAARMAAAHQVLYRKGVHLRVMSVWQKRLEFVGFWYDQLCAESLGKQEAGPTPITSVNTRDLHSRGQQHQQGLRNRVVVNLVVERDEPVFYAGTEHPRSFGPPLRLPAHEAADRNGGVDGLSAYVGKGFDVFNKAARDGTNTAYRDDDRPVMDLVLPDASEYHIGALLQMLMVATVIEGKLMGVNPYGQPGVEAYKRNMMTRLNRA